jgi:hypothetical protein
MEGNENTIKLYYNTEREKLEMPEYGRNILNMVEMLRGIEDRTKRSEQARAVVKAMEVLNPQVHQQEDYEHKLWDHLYMMAGYDLDIDSPYPAPLKEEKETRPQMLPLNTKPIKARHYGRNIESIIDLITTLDEGEMKTSMIVALATYMRQQYLIWNKDSVADETIFSDIEKLSDYRIKVPEGLTLSKISSNVNFSRPGMNMNFNNSQKNNNRGQRQRNGNRRNSK